ncbi:MAG: sugar phosphate nucleotidyltransferase [Chloroflexota bacterium]
MDNNIPVVIYCGGEGTRMRGGTLTKKELVEIGGRPIIWHVMRIFSTYGFNRFVLPLGYEAQQLKNYFLNYEAMNRDLTLRVGNRQNQIDYHGPEEHPEWEVSLIDTGLHTDKASRLGRVADYLDADRFFVTYGDGVGDVNISALMDFHLAHGKLVTITGIQPKHYQYGIMDADEDGLVAEYIQYPELPYWINGGFMVLERSVLDRIGPGDNVPLETGVLQDLLGEDQVMMYRHRGFWQSMDTLKDANELEQIWRAGAPWKTW